MASKPITLKELKKFCDQIPDEKLTQPLTVVDANDGSKYYVVDVFLFDNEDGNFIFSITFDGSRLLT